MTDRELLEAAAKAAPGIASDGLGTCHDMDRDAAWNPLEDDGDALRLAVKLGLVVHVWDDADMASVAKTLPDGEDPPPDSDAWHSADAHACGDIHAATRRAIVRAAAELGKAMP